MASLFSVMFAMCRVPLGFTVICEFRLREAPLRNQVMIGAGTIQVRFSEALFPAASLAKTTMSLVPLQFKFCLLDTVHCKTGILRIGKAILLCKAEAAIPVHERSAYLKFTATTTAFF